MIPKNTAQGVRVGVATNQEARRALYMRTHMGFAELFHDLFISCELGAMKPQREFFENVTLSLGVPPEAILFIDDQSGYIEAARSFGWNTIQFETPSKLRTQLNLAFGVQVPQPSTGALGRGG